MEFLYRDGALYDEKQLKHLALLSYGQFKNALTGENWEKLSTHLANDNLFSGLLRSSKSFVCETNGELVGMAFHVPKGNPTEIFHKEWSYIRMVGVHPNFAGNGIGRKLTKQCMDFARRTDEKIIALHTSEFMTAARYIYESLGFKQNKEIEKRYGKRYWLYLLELTHKSV